MAQLYCDLEHISTTLFTALEMDLNIAQGSLLRKCNGTANELRLNHYPAIAIEKLRDGSTNRIWRQNDLGVITCLFQDSVGGLEIEDRSDGSLVPLPPLNDKEMIVNVSETLQRWTNDQLRAGVH